MIYTNGLEPVVKTLLCNKEEIEKPHQIVEMEELVVKSNGFMALSGYTSSLKPYGLRTDFLDNPQKYNLPDVQIMQKETSDIALYGLESRKQVVRYLPSNYPLPKKTSAFNCYKVFIGKAWGNFSAGYLGGAYADIIVARPNEICTENFLESGIFDDVETAKKHAKYLMTRFTRALLFAKKNSQDNSKEKWVSVPLQDYSESWWDLSIDEIDEKLFDKYSIPEEIRTFVRDNIQPRDESNIKNIL